MSELKNLVAKGKATGYLYKREILDILPNEIVDLEQLEIILQMIKDMKIEVRESNDIDNKI